MIFTLQIPGTPAIRLTGYEETPGEPRKWFNIIATGQTSTTYKCWTDDLVEFDMELRHGTPGHAAMGKLAPSAKSPFSVEWQS